MTSNVLGETRRRFGYALAGAISLGAAWLALPGLPVFWGPRADAATKAAGLGLFEHEWQPHDSIASGDGLGPVFNARSCVACHFQGGVGGGGGNDQNVRAFEAMPTKAAPEVKTGLVHKFAVQNRFLEGSESLRKLFPVIPGGLKIVGNCQVLTRDLDPVRTESVNSTALFGAGWLDRISPKSITHQSLKKSLATVGRELSGDFRGVPPGRYRVLADGRVGKFGWKAQFATLEEFVAAACANEIGLGNPAMAQAKPMGCRDYPDVAPDLDSGQFRALVAFVDTLPRPVESIPSPPGEEEKAARGRELFSTIGCAICHTPNIGGVAGVYSDFLLHRLVDREQARAEYGGVAITDVPLPSEHPTPDEWKTPPLWGVADSAPYLHDGASATLDSAIARHRGDAEQVTQAFRALPEGDRESVIAFLGTLKAPADAKPAKTPSDGFLAAKRPSPSRSPQSR